MKAIKHNDQKERNQQFTKDGFEEEVSSLKDVNLLRVVLGETGRYLSNMTPYIQNRL